MAAGSGVGSDIFDADTIISRAKAAITTGHEPDPCREPGQAGLEAAIKHRERHDLQLRRKIVAICHEILQDPRNGEAIAIFQPEDYEALTSDTKELVRSLRAKPDFSKGDIYAVQPGEVAVENDDAWLLAAASSTMFDPRVERVLKEHERHAKIVQAALRRELQKEKEKGKRKRNEDECDGVTGNTKAHRTTSNVPQSWQKEIQSSTKNYKSSDPQSSWTGSSMADKEWNGSQPVIDPTTANKSWW